ncbi:MAG: tetratricopeptide repeat protein, partial [Asgard group archaeon]|nr:tetratricopeptide repeat protein [Asgard group archaeon]
MSSTIKKQLQEVERLLIHGDFQEGLALIEKNLKKKAISKEEKLGFLVLKSTILNDLGKHKEALETAEEALNEGGEIDNILLHVDALFQKGHAAYFVYEDMNEFITCIDKGLELLDTTKLAIPEKELAKRKALLLNYKGQYFLMSGNIKECLKIVEESIPFARKSEDKRILTICLIWAAYFTRKINYIEEAYEIASEIGNKMLLALSYVPLSGIEARKYNYNEAIELYEKAFPLLEEVGSTYLRELLYNNLGLYYQANYQLDKALECFQRALKGSRVQSYIMLGNIGYNYYLMYELEEARKYYLQSMKKCEELKDYRILPNSLYQLINISLEFGENDQAQNYLNRLKQISEEAGTEYVSHVAHFATVLLLKAS